MRSLLLRLAWLGVVGACTTMQPAREAGPDATDAFVTFDAVPDDTTMCAMDCPLGRACCLGATGPRCVDLSGDIANCGACNRDCVASRQGDACTHNHCTCGDPLGIGCTGGENSICCPSIAGARPYCANPGLDLSDCGGCGRACDRGQANQCQGGMCLCGNSGGPCAGTRTSLCCSDPAGFYACANTNDDQAHCGRCGHRCMSFAHCVAGACVSTISDAGRIDGGG